MATGLLAKLVTEVAKTDIGKEFTKKLEGSELKKTISVIEQIEKVKNMPLQQLEYINDKIVEEKANEVKKGLTDEEKAKIKEETGWSDDIVDAIGSMEEYEIYKKAGLQEAEIDGKKFLIRSDIDWNQKDEMGRTNKERVESKPPDGPLSPINKNGETIELHHIGQKSDSPLAELTKSEHIKNGNYSILHDTQKTESEINRNDFNKEKREYWIARSNQT